MHFRHILILFPEISRQSVDFSENMRYSIYMSFRILEKGATMNFLRIAENIVQLRKQKGVTQDESDGTFAVWQTAGGNRWY